MPATLKVLPEPFCTMRSLLTPLTMALPATISSRMKAGEETDWAFKTVGGTITGSPLKLPLSVSVPTESR